MPFDGCEFSRSPEPLPPGPSPSIVAPSGPRTWLARAWTGLRAFSPAGPERPERQPLDSAACLLRAARALIEAEGNWVVRTYCTRDGKHCAVGALRTAARSSPSEYGRKVRQEAHGLLRAVAKGRGFDTVERMNDESTHAEVLTAFDRAIASAARHQPAT